MLAVAAGGLTQIVGDLELTEQVCAVRNRGDATSQSTNAIAEIKCARTGTCRWLCHPSAARLFSRLAQFLLRSTWCLLVQETRALRSRSVRWKGALAPMARVRSGWSLDAGRMVGYGEFLWSILNGFATVSVQPGQDSIGLSLAVPFARLERVDWQDLDLLAWLMAVEQVLDRRQGGFRTAATWTFVQRFSTDYSALCNRLSRRLEQEPGKGSPLSSSAFSDDSADPTQACARTSPTTQSSQDIQAGSFAGESFCSIRSRHSKALTRGCPEVEGAATPRTVCESSSSQYDS